MNQSELDVLIEIFGKENVVVIEEKKQMNGKIARVLLAKKFGFIRGEDGKDYFFHQTDFNGFFEDLEADYKHGKPILVTFEPTEGKKGLRAINITRLDGGV